MPLAKTLPCFNSVFLAGLSLAQTLREPKSGICRLCRNFPNSLSTLSPKSLLWAVEGPQYPWLLLLSYMAFVKSSVIRAVYTENFIPS